VTELRDCLNGVAVECISSAWLLLPFSLTCEVALSIDDNQHLRFKKTVLFYYPISILIYL
jgi:hypothetical protein